MSDRTFPEGAGYSINVAARRTGLPQETIRAWERRYGALHPARTDGGHRLYSDSDLERLRLLRLATEAGHRIGQVAPLDDAALVELLRADARQVTDVERPERLRDDLAGETGGPASATSDPRVAACLRAVEDLDAVALQHHLEQAALDLPRSVLVDAVLAHLIEAIGEGYDRGRLRPAHEHLGSSVLAAFGQTLRAAYAVPASAPTLVAATPAHQHHELGAALAGVVAAAEGWQVVYLGPNLPAEEIAAAAHSKAATAVALSLVFPPDDRLLADEIRRLRRLLDRHVALVVGGRAARDYRAVLEEVGGLHAPDFATFRRILGELRTARASLVLEGPRGAMGTPASG
jgi:DNA-binding transcriptional MerR regulator/methylmalonyl-CoA mutase cobalamin-binding subunit